MESSSTSEVRATPTLHPSFQQGNASTAVQNPDLVIAFDNSLEPGKEYLVHRNYIIRATNERGEEELHYVNDHTLESAMTWVYGSRKTKYFTNKQALENAGFKWSYRLRAYSKEEYQEFYGGDVQLGAHTPVRIDQSRPTDKWLVGLEVEKEDETMRRKGLAWKMVHETGWVKERDGSLASDGFELVSPILPMFDSKELRKSFGKVKPWLNAATTRSCGGHINVSCKDLDNVQVLNKLKPAMGILYALYQSRMNNSYCRVRPFTEYINNATKYNAFNLSKYGGKIVEIRIFPAVKDAKQLLWRVELLKIFLTVHDTFVKKIASMLDEKSWLYSHLRKSGNESKIREWAVGAVRFQREWVGMSADEKKALLELGFTENEKILAGLVS